MTPEPQFCEHGLNREFPCRLCQLANYPKLEGEVTRLKAELAESRKSGQQAADSYQNLGEVMFAETKKLEKENEGLKAELNQANTIAGDAKSQNERLVTLIEGLKAELTQLRQGIAEREHLACYNIVSEATTVSIQDAAGWRVRYSPSTTTVILRGDNVTFRSLFNPIKCEIGRSSAMEDVGRYGDVRTLWQDNGPCAANGWRQIMTPEDGYKLREKWEASLVEAIEAGKATLRGQRINFITRITSPLCPKHGRSHIECLKCSEEEVTRLKAELNQANTIAGDAKSQNERLVTLIQGLKAELAELEKAYGTRCADLTICEVRLEKSVSLNALLRDEIAQLEKALASREKE